MRGTLRSADTPDSWHLSPRRQPPHWTEREAGVRRAGVCPVPQLVRERKEHPCGPPMESGCGWCLLYTRGSFPRPDGPQELPGTRGLQDTSPLPAMSDY